MCIYIFVSNQQISKPQQLFVIKSYVFTVSDHEYLCLRQCEYTVVKVRTCNSLRVLAEYLCQCERALVVST